MSDKFDISAIEAMILAAPEPLPVRKITDVLNNDVTSKMVDQAIDELNKRYSDGESSFRIRKIAGGYQFYIIPEFTDYVEELFARQRKLRLTRAALESLAIVAYRQPVTKTEIEHIRGVASDGVIHNLMEKKMITITGRSESVGRPLQYGSTDEFLKFFGINSLKDLPQMKEIEEILKSEDSRDQTELELESAESEFVKLNVADGTFAGDSEETVEDLTASIDSSEDSSEIEPSETVEVESNEMIAPDDNDNTEESDSSQIVDEQEITDDEEEPTRVIVDMDAT